MRPFFQYFRTAEDFSFRKINWYSFRQRTHHFCSHMSMIWDLLKRGPCHSEVRLWSGYYLVMLAYFELHHHSWPGNNDGACVRRQESEDWHSELWGVWGGGAQAQSSHISYRPDDSDHPRTLRWVSRLYYCPRVLKSKPRLTINSWFNKTSYIWKSVNIV